MSAHVRVGQFRQRLAFALVAAVVGCCSACGGKSLASDSSAATASGAAAGTVGSGAASGVGGSSGAASGSVGATSGGGSTAGVAGSGGVSTGGSGGLASGGTGGTGLCPTTRPTNYSTCAGNNLHCNYGGSMCAPDNITCQGGVWVPGPFPEFPALSCQAFASNPPTEGQSCACMGNLMCTFNECSGRGQLTATCDNASWHVTTAPCPTRLCGGGQNDPWCTADQICVEQQGDIAITHQCVADPCQTQGQPTSCACAAQLCGGPATQCSYQSDMLTCSCPVCG